jgi:hypothetical protein
MYFNIQTVLTQQPWVTQTLTNSLMTSEPLIYPACWEFFCVSETLGPHSISLIFGGWR